MWARRSAPEGPALGIDAAGVLLSCELLANCQAPAPGLVASP